MSDKKIKKLKTSLGESWFDIHLSACKLAFRKKCDVEFEYNSEVCRVSYDTIKNFMENEYPNFVEDLIRSEYSAVKDVEGIRRLIMKEVNYANSVGLEMELPKFHNPSIDPKLNYTVICNLDKKAEWGPDLIEKLATFGELNFFRDGIIIKGVHNTTKVYQSLGKCSNKVACIYHIHEVNLPDAIRRLG